MPSTIVKEYIVLKGTSASFTQTKPLNDVIKTDLVSITVFKKKKKVTVISQA